MTAAGQDYNRLSHPVDLMEHIACLQDWVFERSSEDELTVSVAGAWCDYHISFNWRDDLESLHMACAFDFKVPKTKIAEIYRLLVLINEQLWLGHFDVWSSEGLLLYRQGLMLNGAEPTAKQCEALLQAALETCERYYQAFQFVVWAGKRAEDALASTIFETEGQA
ncbi:MAG: YbjN domain-containing protein [Rhodomicrobium sp.]